jgi:hypothetical protein
MPLHTDGYLSRDIVKWVTKNRAEHEPHFALVDRLNRVSQKAHARRRGSQQRQPLIVGFAVLRPRVVELSGGGTAR